MTSTKLKALATAELVRPMLVPLADRIDFEFAGYALDHVVMPRDELKRRVADVDVLVCEYDTIDAEIFDAAKKLQIIVCCRGGVKTVIDLDRAMQQGVIVCNNLGRNAAAVSELVMAFLLDLARNVTKTTNLIHGVVLFGKKLGKKTRTLGEKLPNHIAVFFDLHWLVVGFDVSTKIFGCYNKHFSS